MLLAGFPLAQKAKGVHHLEKGMHGGLLHGNQEEVDHFGGHPSLKSILGVKRLRNPRQCTSRVLEDPLYLHPLSDDVSLRE